MAWHSVAAEAERALAVKAHGYDDDDAGATG